MINFIFQDFSNNPNNTKGKIIALCFRLANICFYNKILKTIFFPYRILYKFFFEYIIGFEVPYNTRIGRGLKVFHLQAIVINKNTIIGENCIIRQSTTIGNKDSTSGCPIIGNNVNIGANVCIVGAITIGNNVVIGAGSVVVKNIPDNCTVVGNPARIINNNVV